jgi:DNA-directed RNA polymerase specialized sigma54-like protein
MVDCGAACGKNAAECVSKIANMVSKTAQVVANILSFGASKLANANLAKVATYMQKFANFAAKVSEYAEKIQKAAAANGKPISRQEAEQRAKEQFATVLGAESPNENAGNTTQATINKIWDTVGEIDPSGIVAAAKAFYFPRCTELA